MLHESYTVVLSEDSFDRAGPISMALLPERLDAQ